jgi:hypothetical protein
MPIEVAKLVVPLLDFTSRAMLWDDSEWEISKEYIKQLYFGEYESHAVNRFLDALDLVRKTDI